MNPNFRFRCRVQVEVLDNKIMQEEVVCKLYPGDYFIEGLRG